ncbi:MAG TPA: 50S ribosomal protein L15 [Polyangiaceae bacterium]|nr:50S ribosomal protein L15 [Polyangiaceae bacterium]
MSTILSRLSPPPGSRKAEKRFGRGIGSGLGKTAGKGSKGQKARHGGDFGKLHFQGGQTPMQRRLPKRGFRVPFPIETITVNLGDLENFEAGSTVDETALRSARLVQGRGARIKVLGDGELSKVLEVHAHGFSKSAREKIEQAGGKAVVIATKPVEAESAG